MLVQSVFLLFDTTLGLAQLVILLIDVLLVLAFKLEELLLRLVDLVILDPLGLDLGLRDYLVLSSIKNHLLDDDINSDCYRCPYKGSY